MAKLQESLRRRQVAYKNMSYAAALREATMDVKEAHGDRGKVQHFRSLSETHHVFTLFREKS